ncbi:MAG: hypothetical protein H6621_05065 [Halobacteriovoraceae bacterium]|nr:hypothetical protein [Halobacteriovoraceae bacterium]
MTKLTLFLTILFTASFSYAEEAAIICGDSTLTQAVLDNQYSVKSRTVLEDCYSSLIGYLDACFVGKTKQVTSLIDQIYWGDWEEVLKDSVIINDDTIQFTYEDVVNSWEEEHQISRCL